MPKKKTVNNPLEEEKNTQQEAEAMASYASSEPSADVAADNLDEEAEKGLIVEQAADTDQVVPAELAAIKEDNETAKTVNKKGSTKKAADTSKKTVAKKSGRSASYQKAKEQVEAGKAYVFDEAVELVKKMSSTKFDGAVELHLRLTKKKTKGNTESSRGVFHLPHGSGKDKKIIVLDEAKIEQIAKTKKIDFDVALASPELMPKVAKIAKILGPKGKMPDPKSGTVTTDPKKTIEEINSGKVEYRVDSSNNIHQMIGRVSWEADKLKANAQVILSSLPKSKIAAAYLTSSMSPSVPLDLSYLK